MTAFAETLETVRREQALPILKIMTASDDNMIKGKICSHNPALFTSKTLTSMPLRRRWCISIWFERRPQTWYGTHLPPLWQVWFRNAYRARGITINNRMCLLPPPPVLSACTMPQYRCYTDPTCLPPCTHQHPPPPTHQTTCTKLWTSSTDFPIGCRVVVASSHPTHAGKGGTVCKKFVTFSSDDSPTNSSFAYSPNHLPPTTPMKDGK